jgi:opacity protein-like surface antigen
LKKTTAAIAIAALAVPAAAQADKPENAGSHGRDKAAQKQSHGKKSDRFRGVGFTVRGVNFQGTVPPESRESQTVSEFSLDVTSANKHARRYLGLTEKSRQLRQNHSQTSINDTVDGKAIVRLVGFEQGEQPDADDRVNVVGRVSRTRKSDSSSSTERKLDIRRITIKDVDATDGEQEKPEQEQPDQEKAEQGA